MPERSRIPTSRPPAGEAAPERARSRDRVGLMLGLILVWLWFEYGRPTHPLGIPMLISAISLLGFLRRPDKRWGRPASWLVAMGVLLVIEIPMAANTPTAFWTTYGMVVVFACICLPLPSLLTSVDKIRAFANAWVAVALYVAVFAVFNAGYGPAGAAGGQDENYVAAMMGMAVPIAYFSIFASKRPLVKVLFVVSIVLFCGATVVAGDVSRGGFLGLCAVFLYCLAKSPRKWLGVVIIVILVVAAFGFAGPEYWNDLWTIEDVNEGTADMRLEIWQIGVRMWRAHPVFGVGPGSFRYMVTPYQSEEQLAKFGRYLDGTFTHSLFVEMLAELGLVGVTIFAGLLWHTWRGLREVQRSRSSGSGRRAADEDLAHLRCYSDAFTASLLACLVNGVFLSLFYYSHIWVLIAASSGVAQVYRAQIRKQPVPAPAASRSARG